MTGPTTAGQLPVYLRVGDGEERQVGMFVIPDGGRPPNNTEIGRLLHQIADAIGQAPEGVHAAAVAVLVPASPA